MWGFPTTHTSKIGPPVRIAGLVRKRKDLENILYDCDDKDICVWSGVEWNRVDWSGVASCGVEWSGIVWSGVEGKRVSRRQKTVKNKEL